jgi:hypothetical protein
MDVGGLTCAPVPAKNLKATPAKKDDERDSWPGITIDLLEPVTSLEKIECQTR